MTAYEARKITDKAIEAQHQKIREEVAELKAEIDILIAERASNGGDRCRFTIPNSTAVRILLIETLRNDGFKVEKEFIYW